MNAEETPKSTPLKTSTPAKKLASTKPTPIKKEVAKPAKKEKAAPVKKGTKRTSTEKASTPKKRVKREKTPVEDSEEEDEALDSDESEEPKSTTKKSRSKATAKTPVKKVKMEDMPVNDESEEDGIISEDEDETPYSESNSKRTQKSKIPEKTSPSYSARTSTSQSPSPQQKLRPGDESQLVEDSRKRSYDDSEDEEGGIKRESIDQKRVTKKPKLESESEDEPKMSVKSKIEGSDNENTKSVIKSEKRIVKDEDSKVDDSDSEMSVVLDGPLTTKARKKRQTKAKSSTAKSTKSSSTTSKPRPTKSKTPAESLSPTSSQIKILQSQLVKCGVRKIWAFELKAYGDDSKAKIKHLQGMLKDIGMTGRFSDQRAKEIKEQRELMADLEAVKEGEKSWGLNEGRRARRSLVKGKKNLRESLEGDEEEEISVSGGGDDDDDDDDDDAEEVEDQKLDGLHGLDPAFLSDEDSDD